MKILREQEEEFFNSLDLGIDKDYVNNLDEFIHEETVMASELPSQHNDDIPVDLLVDVHNIYQKNHEPWLYFRNGYVNECEYLPITISDYPELALERDLHITPIDFNKLRQFVCENKTFLLNVISSRYGDRELQEAYYKYQASKQQSLNETLSISDRNLFPDDTGLPVKIYIDTSETYKRGGHYKRLKFEIPGYPNTFGYITFPELKLGKDIKQNISPKLYEEIKAWMFKYKEELNKVFDKKMSIDTFKQIIKGAYQEELPDTWQKASKPLHGYTLIKNSRNKFNFINDNGDLISDKWFDYATPMRLNSDGYPFADVMIGDVGKFFMPDKGLIDNPMYKFK